MPGTPRYAIQCFEHRDGALVWSQRLVAADAAQAKTIATEVLPGVAGAVTLCFAIDDETGQPATITVIERLGETPADLAERLADEAA